MEKTLKIQNIHPNEEIQFKLTELFIQSENSIDRNSKNLCKNNSLSYTISLQEIQQQPHYNEHLTEYYNSSDKRQKETFSFNKIKITNLDLGFNTEKNYQKKSYFQKSRDRKPFIINCKPNRLRSITEIKKKNFLDNQQEIIQKGLEKNNVYNYINFTLNCAENSSCFKECKTLKIKKKQPKIVNQINQINYQSCKRVSRSLVNKNKPKNNENNKFLQDIIKIQNIKIKNSKKIQNQRCELQSVILKNSNSKNSQLIQQNSQHVLHEKRSISKQRISIKQNQRKISHHMNSRQLTKKLQYFKNRYELNQLQNPSNFKKKIDEYLILKVNDHYKQF